jgi:hypothetical protein
MSEKTPVYFIDEKDIREIVKKENPSGKVGDLNIPALEKKINALPAIDSANVYLNLNGKLNLNISRYQHARMRVCFRDGKFYSFFVNIEITSIFIKPENRNQAKRNKKNREEIYGSKAENKGEN